MAFVYMQRRASGTYEFRRRLPEAIAGKPAPNHMRDGFPELINGKTGRFKRELVRSLGTKDTKEAKRRDHRAALEATALFDDALAALTPLPLYQSAGPIDFATLEQEIFAEVLSADELERQEGDDRRTLQAPDERAEWNHLVEVRSAGTLGMETDHFAVYGEHTQQLLSEYKAAFAKRDPTIVRAETRIAFKSRGWIIHELTPEFQKASLAVLKAHVRAYEAIARRNAGEIIETPSSEPSVVLRKPSSPTALGPRLSEAFASWRDGGNAPGAKRPNAHTVAEAESALRIFRELHGDLRIGEITKEKARQFRDAIARIPVALPKDLRTLDVGRLLERDLSSYKKKSAATVNKIVQLLGGIVSKAEREGHLDKVSGFSNPFGKAVRFAIDRQKTGRKMFEKADLKAIFSSPVYAEGDRPAGGGGEAAFWFPLIALFSGMRLDEIAQLRICDLRKDDETQRWYFDIDTTGNRAVKTSSSIRQVPVHRELSRLGLIRYREALLRRSGKPEGPLWPDVLASGHVRTRSASWSKWFGRYLRADCGVSDKAKVFHSFRHTFKRLTRDSEVAEEVHDALTGHANGESVGRGYGKGFSLKPLIKAIDAVKSPVDLSRVKWRSH